MELADMDEAERSLTRNEELVRDLGQPPLRWATMHHRATLKVLHADPDAEAAITAAHDFGLATIGPDIAFLAGGHRRSFLWDRGRIGEMADWFRGAVEHMAKGQEWVKMPLLNGVYASILVENDQTEAAVPFFDELAAIGFAHPTNNVGWLMFETECAYVCARLGRKECVEQLRSMLGDYSDQMVVGSFAGWVTGPVSYYLALLATTAGNWREAEAQFTAAAATQERIGAPTYLARTRVEWARMLLSRREPGDADRAATLLHQALDTARALGLPPIESDTVALLAEHEAGR
jgi:hypothetical protein